MLPFCTYAAKKMAGRMSFTDNADLRVGFTGALSNDFVFRSPGNLFTSLQFVPEKILQFAVSPVSFLILSRELKIPF